MPMNNPPHPGKVVRVSCLEPLGLSVTEGAKALGVSRQAPPSSRRTNQRSVHVNHFSLRHLRVQTRTHRPTEYLPESLLPPALTYPRQAPMIRQPLVQPIPDEPPDRQVHLRLAHQPTVVNQPQQKARQHQTNRHFRVDLGTAALRAIAIRHFLTKPTQVQYAVHTGQNVILRYQLLQRTRHEQVELFAMLGPNISYTSQLGRVGIPTSDHKTRTFSTTPYLRGARLSHLATGDLAYLR